MPAKNLARINDVGTYSHIYNKGVENRIIFNDEEDYKIFLKFLRDYLTPQDPTRSKQSFQVHGRTFQGIPHQPKNYFNQLDLIAYSLTPSSFHLLLHQNTQGSIEKFLRSLCTRYSMYFNKKYKRNGSLFAGPYKSVQIKDELRLSRLTAFLHHLSNNSSYQEYLGSRNTTWVKSQIVLSLFKGTSDYKNFVEKYEHDQNEKEPGKSDHLERSLEGRNLTSEPDLPPLKDLKVRSKMPQFLAISTLGFILLVSLSIRNIYISKALSYQPQPTPAVLSETTTTAPSPTPEATPLQVIEASPSATLEASPSATLEATAAAVIKPEPKPEISLRVKIDDGSSFVNIRQKPTVNSEKIGQANDGDTFEFISLQLGWYEIKLSDGSYGFISARYALKEETNQ